MYLLFVIQFFSLHLTDFFFTGTNEICSHLSEKASNGRFLTPEKLQNHSNERKGKDEKKE